MSRVRSRSWIAVTALVALSVAMLAVGTATRPAAAQMGTMGGTRVDIANFAFQPASLQVGSGTTVTWVNDDAVPHTVTADNGSWGSGTLAPGQSFSVTFTLAGNYPYHCSIHPMMTGNVFVPGGGMGTGMMG